MHYNNTLCICNWILYCFLLSVLFCLSTTADNQESIAYFQRLSITNHTHIHIMLQILYKILATMNFLYEGLHGFCEDVIQLATVGRSGKLQIVTYCDQEIHIWIGTQLILQHNTDMSK